MRNRLEAGVSGRRMPDRMPYRMPDSMKVQNARRSGILQSNSSWRMPDGLAFSPSGILPVWHSVWHSALHSVWRPNRQLVPLTKPIRVSAQIISPVESGRKTFSEMKATVMNRSLPLSNLCQQLGYDCLKSYPPGLWYLGMMADSSTRVCVD